MLYRISRFWSFKFIFSLVLLFATPFSLTAQTAYLQHTVEAQETLYGIARRFSVTIDDVLAANPGLSPQNLRRGQVIRVPANTTNTTNTPTNSPTRFATAAGTPTRHTVQQGETIWGIAHQYGLTVEALKAANPEMERTDYVLPIGASVIIPSTGNIASSANRTNSVRVALVLPIKAQRPEVERCKEFFNGVLIAAEEMKQQGRAVTIYAYEEDPNDITLSDLQGKLRANPVDIIYGPLYPAHFPALADFAKRNNVRLVVPFSSKVTEVEQNTNIYVVNTPTTHRNRAAAENVVRQFGRTHIVFLQTPSGNEADFVRQLKSKSAAAGATFSELPANFTDRQLLSIFATHDRVLFVPNGSQEKDYQSVITRLDKLRSDMPLLNTSLLGYPDWQKYQDEDRMKWYACDTYLFCPAFYNPYDDKVKIFVRKYRDRYHTDLLPYYPRYGALGYDLALQTMTNFLAHGREVKDFTAVQSRLSFEKANSGGGYVNTNIWLMHFKKDRTINLIGVR